MDASKVVKEKEITEDAPLRPNIFAASLRILVQFLLTIVIWLPISVLFLPFYIPGLLVWGLPPIISPWSRFYKYFVASWTEGRPEDNIPFTNRILVFLTVLDSLVKSPINGVCWFVDEILYGRYRKCDIENPLFFISAARSGSTQLVEYIEDDEENFIAPMAIEVMYPYIWAWKMASIFKWLGLKPKHFDFVKSLFVGNECEKRHNTSLFKTDTWEGTVGLMWHFLFLCQNLGSPFYKWGFVQAALKEEPMDEDFNKSYNDFSDLIMRKVMYYRGKPTQHMVLKGHQLALARDWEQRYKGAKFLTVVREPAARFQSLINFYTVLNVDGPSVKRDGLFRAMWRTTRDWTIETQLIYCEEEMLFYDEGEDNKLVIPFTSYVKDLSKTLERVYSFCNISVPAEVLTKAADIQKSSHDRTKRKTTYDTQYNRSLTSLGVDEDQLKEQLADYIEWVKKFE